MPQQRAPQDVAERSESERKRIDLSVAQVAASALATIVGALLASELGVYGTIIGAAVVSIGATTGSAVLQHLFRRGGEQLRQAVDRTDRKPQPPENTELSSEWNAPQTVRAKRRWTWKTCLAVSGLVFALAMGPILAFELMTGQPVSATVKGDSGSGTSLGGSVEQKPAAPPPSSLGSSGPSSSTPSGSTPSSTPSGTPLGSPSGSPSSTPSGTPSGSPSSTPSSTPTDSATTSGAGAAATPSGTPSP
ncbi:hypothetical protein [Kitasatospora sp. Root107]|nr:hypothetical protein [Kitasatospora sp. Root107]KQV21231.1 hypothetical protein ASC99_19560 [Kitasatospora sp. Root107]KRB69420.1 hypothetical protein ASE03_26995 [Kitasatospora sp. Root187]